MCVFACARVHVCLYLCPCVDLCTYSCAHVCTCVCACSCICVCLSVVLTCVHSCVCTYVCAWGCACMCSFITGVGCWGHYQSQGAEILCHHTAPWYPPFLAIHSLNEGHLGCFQIFAFTNKAFMNIHEHEFSFLWGKHLGE